MAKRPNMSKAQRLMWQAMSPEERRQRMAIMFAKRAKWYAGLSEEEKAAYHAKRAKNRQRAMARRRLAKQPKLCGTCRETKPAAEFSPEPARRDGLTYNCKACRAAANRVRRAAKAVEPVAPPRIIETPKRKGFLYTIRALFRAASAT